MSLLTGKSKKDFHKWINNKGYHEEVIYNSVINYLIIEWLDSVGINIAIEITDNDFNKNVCYSYAIYGEHKFEDYIGYKNRQHATEKAIIKSIQIYNKK